VLKSRSFRWADLPWRLAVISLVGLGLLLLAGLSSTIWATLSLMGTKTEALS